MLKVMGWTYVGSLETSGGGWQPTEGTCKLGCRPLTSCEVEHIQDNSYSSNLSSHQLGNNCFSPSFLHSCCPDSTESVFCVFIANASLAACCWLLNNSPALCWCWKPLFPHVYFFGEGWSPGLVICWFSVRPTAIQCSRKEFIIFGKMPRWLSQNPWWCP